MIELVHRSALGMTQYREESPGVISIQIYQPSECKMIVEELKSLSGWTPATVRDAKDADNYEVLTRRDIRSSRTLVSRDTQKFYQDFDRRMNAALKPLVKQRWEVDLTEHSGTHLLRYGPADYYVPHRDTGPGFEDRYFSVVCYLNSDFQGGQTSFPEVSYSVTPESGKAIIFPSQYLHGSVPVTSGEKF